MATPLPPEIQKELQGIFDEVSLEEQRYVAKHPPPPATMTASQAIGRGFVSGLAQAPKDVGTAVEWLGRRLGSETIAGAGKTAREYWGKAQEQYQPSRDIAGKSWVDDPSLLLNSSYMLYHMSEMASSMLPLVLGGEAGGALALRGAGMMGKIPSAVRVGTKMVEYIPENIARLIKVGQMAGAGIAGGTMGAAGTYEKLLAEGRPEQEASIAAEGMGVMSGLLMALSVPKVLNVVGQGLKTRLANKAIAGTWMSTAVTAMSPAELASEYIAKIATGQPLPEDIQGDVVQSLKEGVTGGLFAGLMGAAMGHKALIPQEKSPPLPGIEQPPPPAVSAVDALKKSYTKPPSAVFPGGMERAAEALTQTRAATAEAQRLATTGMRGMAGTAREAVTPMAAGKPSNYVRSGARMYEEPGQAVQPEVPLVPYREVPPEPVPMVKPEKPISTPEAVPEAPPVVPEVPPAKPPEAAAPAPEKVPVEEAKKPIWEMSREELSKERDRNLKELLELRAEFSGKDRRAWPEDARYEEERLEKERKQINLHYGVESEKEAKKIVKELREKRKSEETKPEAPVTPEAGKKKKPKKVLLRDVKAAEREYANAMTQWGENNLATSRALGRWQELKKAWDTQKKKPEEPAAQIEKPTKRLPAPDLEKWTQDITKDWQGRVPRVVVAQSLEDLLKRFPTWKKAKVIQQAIKEGHIIRGLHKGDTVAIIADHISSRQDFERTFAHEVMHFGTRTYLGDQWGPIMDTIWKDQGGTTGMREFLDKYPRKDAETLQDYHRRLADEKLARMAHDAIPATTWNRIVAAVREFFRKLGFTMEFSENDVKVLLDSARRAVTEGGKGFRPVRSASAMASMVERQVTPGDVNTPEFKQWFGKSKVVDRDGKPLVVYRGALSERGETGSPDNFIYFSRDPKIAEGAERGYIEPELLRSLGLDPSKHIPEGLRVVPAYLSLKNPATVKDLERIVPNAKTIRSALPALKEAGFDGFMSDYEIIAFSPTQIKSIFNRGTWSPTEPNISLQVERPLTPEERTIKDYQDKNIAWEPKGIDFSKEGLKNQAAKFYTKFVMGEYPIVRLAKKSGQQTVKTIEEQVRRIRAKGGMVEDIVTGRGPFKLKSDGNIDPNRTSPSLEKVLKPINTKEEFRNFVTWRTAKRDVALFELREEGQYKDIDVDGSRAVIRAIEAKYGPQEMTRFRNIDKEYRTFEVKACLDPLRDIGWLSQERYDEIVNSPEAEFYSSFSRELENVETELTGGRGGTPFLYRVKGTKLKVIPAVESTIANVHRTVNLVERQRLFHQIVALKDATPDLAEAIKRVQAPPGSHPRNSILVGEAGKKHFYRVPEDVFRAIENYSPSEASTVVKLLSFPARTLRAGATLTLDFIARNPVRDQFSAMLYSKYGYIPGVDFVKGLSHILKDSDLYHEFKAAGGEQAYFVSLDRQATHLRARDVVGYKKTGLEKFKTVNPIEALRIMSEWMEKGTRVGLYAKAKAKGATALEAMTESREGTLDFRRIGQERAINQIVAFWNANVQGSDKMVRAFREAPGKTTMRALLGITLPSMILWGLNHDDDRYKALPEWQKNFFWIIPVGKDGPIIRIPKPFEIGLIFGSLPERVLDWMFLNDVSQVKSIAKALQDGAMPGLIPTAALPVIENIANYSFFMDRPLESLGIQRLPAGQRYTPYTTEVAKKVGKLTDISPIKIENWVRAWTGGLGYSFMQLAGNAMDETPEVGKKWYEAAPSVRGFIAREPIGSQSEYVNKFYDMLEKDSQAKLGYKTLLAKGEPGEAMKYFKAHQKEISAFSMANRMSVTLSKIRKQRDMIVDKKTMNPDIKRKAVDRLNRQISDMAKRFVEMHQ